MDMISAIAFLDLFSWDGQVAAPIRMIQFPEPLMRMMVIHGSSLADNQPAVNLVSGLEKRLAGREGNCHA